MLVGRKGNSDVLVAWARRIAKSKNGARGITWEPAAGRSADAPGAHAARVIGRKQLVATQGQPGYRHLIADFEFDGPICLSGLPDLTVVQRQSVQPAGQGRHLLHSSEQTLGQVSFGFELMMHLWVVAEFRGNCRVHAGRRRVRGLGGTERSVIAGKSRNAIGDPRARLRSPKTLSICRG